MKKYRVFTGRRWRYFPTLEAASAFASRVFARTGNILGIEKSP